MSELSAAHYTLLAVHYASEHNIQTLASLCTLHQNALKPDLVLRIILSYLPESIEPSEYVSLVRTVATGPQKTASDHATIDISPIKDLSSSQARKRIRKLQLLPLTHPQYPPDGPSDLIDQFIYHRAHRIEEEAGLLTLVPQLASPFLDDSEFLRTWFLASVLPLLRLEYEYYPQNSSPPSLQSFENLDKAKGVAVLMSKAVEAEHRIEKDTDATGNAARDFRGVVSPWMYGNNARKRRKLAEEAKSPSSPVAERVRKLSIDTTPQDKDSIQHGWEHAFSWIVATVPQDFALVTEVFEHWGGPRDVDFGGYENEESYLDEKILQDLSQKYGQAAFASMYAIEADSPECIDGARKILGRVAGMFNFDLPADVTASIDEFPRMDGKTSLLHETPYSVFQVDSLLRNDHPLTTVTRETYRLLEMLTLSAQQLASLGFTVSIVKVAKLCFHGTSEEQLNMFRRIMHMFVANSRKDEAQWDEIRTKLIWLWDWGADAENLKRGIGVFGKIGREVIEQELLKAFISNSYYELATQTFLREPGTSKTHLSRNEAESVIVASALQSYDNASNGNRTRGGIKKASDIVSAFRSQFPESPIFKRMEALLGATHAISFYSLTLQHGVPFQPVNIRVSQDPISLIQKILEQNSRSYTKLDDLTSIAQNLVRARLMEDRDFKDTVTARDTSLAETTHKTAEAESRVIGMAIDASLAEDDFETAYSYIVSRFQPPAHTQLSSPIESGVDPDNETTAWRAAVAAGKYRSNTPANGAAILRRLDQRMDLLSRALLLAPSSALPEILNAWRRVEEEMAAQLAREDEAENAWNDKGDRLSSDSPLPGTFVDAKTAGMEFDQPTREMGRPRARRGDEEAPMGLFDVARGAAAAFNRTAFPLRGTRPSATGRGMSRNGSLQSASAHMAESHLESPTAGSSDEGRVRKRDMAYNAATGVLASGLGWVLGE